MYYKKFTFLFYISILLLNSSAVIWIFITLTIHSLTLKSFLSMPLKNEGAFHTTIFILSYLPVQYIAIHSITSKIPSIIAIIIGGITKARNIPRTKLKIQKPHSFFKIFLKNKTHTSSYY